MTSAVAKGPVGSYAISTVEFKSWFTEPLAPQPQRAKKKRAQKPVIHQIFASCVEVTDDPFWQEKFRNASIGSFPRGFSYNDGVLTYRKGAKVQSIEVSGNPYESSRACAEFFRSKGAIFSPIDQRNSSTLQYHRSQDLLSQKQLEWSDMNKKMQECLLSNYVLEMKEQMGLTDGEKEQLRQTVRLGIDNKVLVKTRIIVHENNIQRIDGLLWNPQVREFYIDPEIKPQNTRSSSRSNGGIPSIDPRLKDTIPKFTAQWEKYVAHLNTKQDRETRRRQRIVINQGQRLGPRLRLVASTTTTLDSTDATLTTDATDDTWTSTE